MKKEKGITLVALVITIIILLILAGVTINVVLGDNGLFKIAKEAGEKYDEAGAREKLETVLVSLQADKFTAPKYNETEYIDNRIIENNMNISGDLVIVDGWKFQIDRSVPKIVANLGKGQLEEQIQIEMTSTTSRDYVKSTIKVEITYEKEIVNLILNGESIEIPEKQEGKYIIEKEVTTNGTYSIIAKDVEDDYNNASVKVSDLTEDMNIYTIEDMMVFRDKVNAGRTFKERTVQLMNGLDLSGICGQTIGSWEPIGNHGTDTKHYFSGTFEGNGHTLSNLYINNSNSYQGLFGLISGAQVNGIILENVKVVGLFNVGSVAGRSLNSTISNCHIKSGSKIQATGKNQYGSYAGGIAGSQQGGTLINCSNGASVTGAYNFAGGIAGTSDGTVSSCFNTGSVVGDISGGIVAHNYPAIEIINCYNKGNIEGVTTGGILGFASPDVMGWSIKNCYNIGKINASSVGGAIVGYNEYNLKEIDNNYWTANSGTSNGRGYPASDTEAEKIAESTLQGYAVTLGDAYTDDIQNKNGTWKYNNGYPILKWQVEQ